ESQLEAHRLGNRHDEVFSRGRRRQVAEQTGPMAPELTSEPCLSDPGGADDGDDPHRRRKERGQLPELTLSADEQASRHSRRRRHSRASGHGGTHIPGNSVVLQTPTAHSAWQQMLFTQNPLRQSAPDAHATPSTTYSNAVGS